MENGDICRTRSKASLCNAILLKMPSKWPKLLQPFTTYHFALIYFRFRDVLFTNYREFTIKNSFFAGKWTLYANSKNEVIARDGVLFPKGEIMEIELMFWRLSERPAANEFPLFFATHVLDCSNQHRLVKLSPHRKLLSI